jgi:L-lactate dehydrogenase (cytochrome)
MAKSIRVDEISRHNGPEDVWIVVENTVYDLTDFAPQHPGGRDS